MGIRGGRGGRGGNYSKREAGLRSLGLGGGGGGAKGAGSERGKLRGKEEKIRECTESRAATCCRKFVHFTVHLITK